MLKCNQPPKYHLLSIFRIPRAYTGVSIFLATPSLVGEYNEEDLRRTSDGNLMSYEAGWLQLLLEGLIALDILTGVCVIFVRTNIRELGTILDKQLYVKDLTAGEISIKIYQELQHLSTKANPNDEPPKPIELRCAPLSESRE